MVELQEESMRPPAGGSGSMSGFQDFRGGGGMPMGMMGSGSMGMGGMMGGGFGNFNPDWGMGGGMGNFMAGVQEFNTMSQGQYASNILQGAVKRFGRGGGRGGR